MPWLTADRHAPLLLLLLLWVDVPLQEALFSPRGSLSLIGDVLDMLGQVSSRHWAG
jgi:hypothetical protein